MCMFVNCWNCNGELRESAGTKGNGHGRVSYVPFNWIDPRTEDPPRSPPLCPSRGLVPLSFRHVEKVIVSPTSRVKQNGKGWAAVRIK